MKTNDREGPNRLRYASLTLLLGMLLPAAVAAQAPFCIPSCDATDARMLSLTPGDGLATLTDTTLELRIAADLSFTQFDIGFFDGDAGPPHWDICAACGAPTTEYRLYADPFNDGTGSFLVATFHGESMPDNDWIDFTVANVPEAESASGMYYYRLEIDLAPDPLAGPISAVLNNLKVRTSAEATLELFGKPFAFSAAMVDYPDAAIVYPSFPATEPTTFDGSFSFFLDLSDPTDADFDLDNVTIWDGDLDYGSFDCVVNDTDDPNTPPLPESSLDSFPISPNPAPEGVAVGQPCPGGGDSFATGHPADDFDSHGIGVVFRRSPSIRYDLLKWNSDGTQQLVASNDDPSGNEEWEKFRVDTSPSGDPDGPPDVVVDSLSEGVYEVRLQGLDMQNLNAFHFERVLCVDSNGSPCPQAPPAFCGACNGKISYLALRYLGAATAQVLVLGDKGKVFFDSTVAPGGWLELAGPGRGALGTKLTIYVDGQLHDSIHTSCSDPIGPGVTFGDFRVIAGQSSGGGPLCPSKRCEINGSSQLVLQGAEVSWQLTNVGTGPATIKQIDLEWPSQNGSLRQITLDSTTFWTGNEGSPATLSEGWNDAYQDRQLIGGDSQPLIFGFANSASTDASGYTVRVTFLESCSVEFQSDGLPLLFAGTGSGDPTRDPATLEGKGRSSRKK